MKKTILALVGAGLIAGALAAHASPEDDRKQLTNYLKKKAPKIKLDQYVNGALIYDKDSMAQYLSIMDFPPFENVVELGKKMWETPLPTARPMPPAFPTAVRTWPATTPCSTTSRAR